MHFDLAVVECKYSGDDADGARSGEESRAGAAGHEERRKTAHESVENGSS